MKKKPNKAFLIIESLFLILFINTSCFTQARIEKSVRRLSLTVRFSKNGAPFIPVKINGKPYLAQIDTGFTGTLLIPRQFNQSLHKRKNIAVQQMWNNQAVKREIVTLSSLSLGKILVASNVTAVFDPSQNKIMVGLGLLSHYNVLFDFPSSNMIFFEHNTIPANNSNNSVLRFQLNPFITLKAHEKDLGSIHLILDSGVIVKDRFNGYYYPVLSLNSHRIKVLLTDQKALPKWKGKPGDASVKKNLFFYTKSLLLDGHNIGETIFIGAPLHPSFHDGALGLGFFMKRRVFIDFRHRLLYLSPLKVPIPRF